MLLKKMSCAILIFLLISSAIYANTSFALSSPSFELLHKQIDAICAHANTNEEPPLISRISYGVLWAFGTCVCNVTTFHIIQEQHNENSNVSPKDSAGYMSASSIVQAILTLYLSKKVFPTTTNVVNATNEMTNTFISESSTQKPYIPQLLSYLAEKKTACNTKLCTHACDKMISALKRLS